MPYCCEIRAVHIIIHLITDHPTLNLPQDAARAIVASSKFAPQGTRGCGSPFTHTVFSIPARTYELECNNNLLVIVQIESRSGVENVQDIAAVDGVDVLFVGPFDLAKSMDIEFGGKEHEDAIAKTLKACKDNKKYAAIFCKSTLEVFSPA